MKAFKQFPIKIVLVKNEVGSSRKKVETKVIKVLRVFKIGKDWKHSMSQSLKILFTFYDKTV